MSEGWMTKIFSRPKSTQEIEEETERLEAEDRKAGLELSIKQKRVATKMLAQRGMKPSHFGDTGDESTWQRAWQWLKTH